ncbi:hypothetical protein IWX46DRAFT_649332 [Phyllosticta citricarpa]|uniref:Uncharacterized protein n=1 Tax=Phyllosticta citricarpa TaxID=55181 RepID=A0ABR1MG04_9PEZI
MTSLTDSATYPFNDPSYIDGLGNGLHWQEELKGFSSLKPTRANYGPSSDMLILDLHDTGASEARYCNDAEIQELLDASNQPKVRFVLLELMPRLDHMGDTSQEAKYGMLYRNKIPNDDLERTTSLQLTYTTKNRLNITRDTLLKIWTKYRITPAAAGHFKGQSQHFGSRISFDDDGRVMGFDSWYAVQERAFMFLVFRDAGLTMTSVTHCDVKTGKSLVLLKHSCSNEQSLKFQTDVVARLKNMVKQRSTLRLVQDPFTLSLFQFEAAIRSYMLSAHFTNEIMCHIRHSIVYRSLETLEIVLWKEQDLFYRLVKKKPEPDDRGWLYVRITQEMDNLGSQIAYRRTQYAELAQQGLRTLDLKFCSLNSLAAGTMARHAVIESASMSTISVVTMLFLPGTFAAVWPSFPHVSLQTSSNLRRQFLEPTSSLHPNARASSGNTKIAFSERWWILPAAAVPLTLLDGRGGGAAGKPDCWG